MANCDKLFRKFNKVITLDQTRKEQLRTSRNAVRERIRRYFREKQNGLVPKFHGQGSFMMNTIICPLDGEFDVDDGIYFKVKVKPLQTINTFHEWIREAIDEHTKQEPIDKQTCVRLVYAREYHLDLPIYYLIEGQTPYLAHKREGWIKSDPREFIKWFNSKADEGGQLKRIVRYLKAWSDNKKSDNKEGNLPSGLIFSTLAANYVVFDERDDLAFYQTLVAIKYQLELSFTCYRPTPPDSENLLEDYSNTKRDYFLGQLGSFIKSAEKALSDELSKKDACEAWQYHFGDRFPFESEEFIEDYHQVNIRYELKIDCLVSQKGFRPHSLIQMILNKLPLLRNNTLEFYVCDCNVPKPFQVKWKVRNVGKEAVKRNQIRGQILNDGGNHRRTESSDFHGPHFVECYIIKNDVCVARSRIEVPIAG
jgi:RNase P protein component